DVVGIDDLDSEWNLGVRVADNVLADTVHVLGDNWILHQLHAGLHLLRVGFAHRYLLLHAVPVAHAARATHVTVADSVHVGFAARMLNFAVILLREGSW